MDSSSLPAFKDYVLTFCVGFIVTHLVEFHKFIEVLLDVVLVGVGFVSIVKGLIHIFEKFQEWKMKNKKLKRLKR
jgi:hypothetical protein